MKVVAQRKGEQVFLVQTKPGMGRVLDLNQKFMFPEHSIDSITARGQWSPCNNQTPLKSGYKS